MRWFHADGVRHRAYFRSSDSDRELVVAAPDWEAVKTPTRANLEEYSDDELVLIARRLRMTEPTDRD
ncbi:MAG TPA: hypothetical protein VMN60_08740 [Longimicrobiales bacterium]|nr:hypothetical protein [Longimicrobiales bacterium]